ncbi:MAG TPA: ABC transporter permease [Bryobacteraceae bacterium]|nr:ABC transporter permease [Bryobacteraceae bacterium]
MFELFIARRYLRAKRKQVVISVITVISVIGVAAGVMALVIAVAITNGFSATLQKNLLGATAAVSVEAKDPANGIDHWEQIAAKLVKLPHVTSATPSLYDPAYISGPVRSTGVIIKGVSLAPGVPIPDALAHLKAGSLEPARESGNLPGIILGARLAEYIGAVIDKPVTLTIAEGYLGPTGWEPSFKRFIVAGIFETGFYDVDNGWAFTSLSVAQKTFGLHDVVNAIELRLDDIYKAPEVEKEAEKVLGPNLDAITWEEQNHQILNALKTERIVTVITIGLIQIVAALNILITLVMMVMEKHRDIAILMSMGARAAQIRKIFVLEGALIGVVGTAIGLTVGYVFCYFANAYRLFPLDETVYSLAYVPFDSRWIDGLWIAGAALAVSLIATLYPARSATRIAPVEALRYE